jgi:Tol biopolymer transport system component
MDARRFGAANLSPDGKRVAAQINDIEGTHVWILSTDRAAAQRLTTTGRNTSPVWSHDGRTVYFASDRDGETDIWRRPADLSGAAEKVLEADGAEFPTSISGDGRWLVYSRRAPGNSDVGRVSLTDDDPAPEILVDSDGDESGASLSPDGRFVCFQSDETGQWDVHVLEIATGRRWVVSSVDGYSPFWTRDGERIMYMSGSESFMSVDVRTDPEFTATDAVLAVRIDTSRMGQTFDVTRDGGQVLVTTDVVGDGSFETRPRVTVVMNFFAQLRARTKGDIPL